MSQRAGGRAAALSALGLWCVCVCVCEVPFPPPCRLLLSPRCIHTAPAPHAIAAVVCLRSYSGVQYDQGAVRIQLGDTLLMERGQPLAYDAAAASAYLKAQAAVHGTVRVDVSIGEGPGQGMAWGCDLSYDYVKVRWRGCWRGLSGKKTRSRCIQTHGVARCCCRRRSTPSTPPELG